MTTEHTNTETHQDGDGHHCVQGHRCCNKVDKKPRQTEHPNTFCPACLTKAAQRIQQLPTQWKQLHAIIGDRHAGIDVNIHRPKPEATIPLNLHVDTLMGDIHTTITTAAEVIADKLNTNNPEHTDPHEHIQACAQLVAPNLHTLTNITGIGGRDNTDPTIDTMNWSDDGNYCGSDETTGNQLIKQLDHYGSLAHFTLGQTRARTQRDTPCTRCRARTVGRWAGSDHYDCTTCGSQFEEDDLNRQNQILIELHRRGLLPKVTA